MGRVGAQAQAVILDIQRHRWGGWGRSGMTHGEGGRHVWSGAQGDVGDMCVAEWHDSW